MTRNELVEMIDWIDQMFEINTSLTGEDILKEYENEVGNLANVSQLEINKKIKENNPLP